MVTRLFQALAASLSTFVFVSAAANAASPATAPTTRPTKVAFVLDASGSMQGAFRGDGESGRKAIDELSGAVEALNADRQFFVVVDLQDGKTLRYPAKGFAKADAGGKAAASKFVVDPAIKAQGGGQIDKTVAAACSAKPDLLWLISDGDFGQDGDKAVDAIVAAAKATSVKINTSLVFAREFPKNRRTLFELSNRTGGQCRDEKGRLVEKMDPPAEQPKKPKPSVFTEH